MPRAVTIAFVGDYGACALSPHQCEREAAVAYHLKAARPDLVVAVGDLNYVHGEAGAHIYPPPDGNLPAHIRQNNLRVFKTEAFRPPGQETGYPPEPPPATQGVELYEQFINNGLFYPVWGNHDWHQSDAAPARELFGERRFPYSVRIGFVELFAVDSNQVSALGDPHPDPDIKAPPDLMSQKDDLVKLLNDSPACWRILYMHHPAYEATNSHPVRHEIVKQFIDEVNAAVSVGKRIDVVVSGHAHLQAHSIKDPIHYFVAGAAGDYLQNWQPPQYGARPVWHNDTDHGFMILRVFPATSASDSFTDVFFMSVKKSNPNAPAWHQKWQAVQSRFTKLSKPDCPPVRCRRTGDCLEGELLSEFSKVDCEGCSDVSPIISTWPSPRCAGEDTLVSAHIRATKCCASPPCQDANFCCPAYAEALDCNGYLLGRFCLRDYWPYGDAYEGETGCVFDKFTLPCSWRVFVPDDTTYGVTCPYDVEYYCCSCEREYVAESGTQ